MVIGSKEKVIARYYTRYIPGQRIYLDRCRPLEKADIVIDNRDLARPTFLKGYPFGRGDGNSPSSPS